MVAFYAPFFARMTDWTDTALTSVASVLEAVHLPFLDWALGRIGSPSWWKGVLACWGAAALLIAAAVRFSSRATNRGLAGGFSAEATAPKVLSATRPNRMLRDPVYRKELLWLWRDRGALVQVFLVPLTLAAVQLFNFRFMLTNAAGSWHLLAGGSVVFGSYFLLVLGPRSLLSEGPALWMPLTWPRGLEALLKAKARLWWICSLLVVGTLLLLTAIRFPADGWKVALTGALYALFSLSLSEKSVTLVTAPSSGGEPEPVPGGRRWATMLGTFTFGLGILTQQWHVAIYGVVFSWGSAAAIWQNFRARLPFLFDPWSERLPPAPTLMHAMIAITALVELTTIATAFFRFALGPAALVVGRSIAYGACAFIVFLVMNYWLSERKVPPGQIWRWDGAPLRSARGALGLFGGVMFGLILASGALGFGVLLEQLPSLSAPLRQLHDQLAANPADRGWMALLAVGFAPVAEEYLFRGLLFRALDREWGGAKAIWGSAAFFAIYHPPLSWLPVALVGAACAWLFKKTGRLLPSVLLHAAYNALLVWSY
jgi:membrane protease YdiL (CAAX protease family)